MKKLFNSDEVSPACRYCSNGIISADEESVLCYKTGIRQLDSSCKSFKYDPLKRIPRMKHERVTYTAEDFKL